MSVPPGRRRETDDDRGKAIRSEQREVPRGVVRLRRKRNKRDKRQDPWRKANDRNSKGRWCRPSAKGKEESNLRSFQSGSEGRLPAGRRSPG
jgi:hypothetical protein